MPLLFCLSRAFHFISPVSHWKLLSSVIAILLSFVTWISCSMWCFYFSFKERLQVPEHVLSSPFPIVLIFKSLIVSKLVSLISLSLASRNFDLAASILTFLSADSSRIFTIHMLMLVLMVQLKTYNYHINI